MQLAFYKAKFGNYIDKTINLATGRLGFSHVEAVFDCETNCSRWSRCYSASHRDSGVRYKDIMLREHWEVLDLDTRDLMLEIKMKEWFRGELGKPYDLKGALTCPFITKPGYWFEQPKWFCSEICTTLLRFDKRCALIYGNNQRISPNELYTKVMQWKQRQSKMNPSSATK